MEPLPHSRLHDIVSALVYSLASNHARADRPDQQPPYNDLTQFVLRQQWRIADYLRLPLGLLTSQFDALGLTRGNLFHRLSLEQRQRQINSWKNSSLGFRRDLIRFYEGLTVLALHSRAAESRSSRREEAHSCPASGIVHPDNNHELRSQICVVGSGPGGSITACLLAEAGRDVLLIEEGPFYSLESCAPFSREEMEQKYRNGGLTVAMGKNKIAYVEGRCVGGGSEINSGLYHRTPPDILEHWRKEFQVEALTEHDLQPHFEACERDLSVSLLPGAAPAASLKLHDGATKLGWKSVEVPRWFKYETPAHSSLLTPHSSPNSGKRQSMTETFIPRFLRAGGRLLPQTRMRTLRQESGKWTLFAIRGDGSASRITADTVFVCAGAVQTPALLRRGGITQNIGNSLRLHPTIKITARFPEAVNTADMGVPVHQVKEFAPRISFGCSISTPPYLALGLLDHPAAARSVTENWPHLANYYAMITGEGSGAVRPLPGFADPLVKYRLTRHDLRELADGLHKLAEALFAAGATTLYPGLSRGPVLNSPDDLKSLPNELPAGLASLMTIHLFSSCPMGEDRSRCATDSFGGVHGFKNLHIADASLLCGAPGVNPQGSIMALAHRNALRFLNR